MQLRWIHSLWDALILLSLAAAGAAAEIRLPHILSTTPCFNAIGPSTSGAGATPARH